MDGRFDLRFRIGPLPVAIEPTFWLGALLLGFGGTLGPHTLVWVAVVLVSILVHELGHALCALAFGVPSRIRLYMFGGLTLPERPLPRWRGLLVSAAGPLTGLALGVACLLARPFLLDEGSAWLSVLAWSSAKDVNLYWSLFNLLPILPLDGGHILLALLGPGRQRLALGLGGATAGLASLWLAATYATSRGQPDSSYQGVYLIALFGFLAFRNLQPLFAKAGGPRPGPSEAITLDEALARGWSALSGGREEEADRLARLVLAHAPDADARNRARDLLAWAALASADARGALRHLERSEPAEAARALTWAMVLDTLGEPRQALPYALRAVEVEPSETAANLAVRLLAATGDGERAGQLAASFAWQRPGAREGALGEAAFAQKSFADAAGHYAAAFALSHLAGDAYNAACSHARAGDRASARTWVERAVGAGFDDLDQLLADPDLALLKDDPALRALVEQRSQRPSA